MEMCVLLLMKQNIYASVVCYRMFVVDVEYFFKFWFIPSLNVEYFHEACVTILCYLYQFSFLFH